MYTLTRNYRTRYDAVDIGHHARAPRALEQLLAVEGAREVTLLTAAAEREVCGTKELRELEVRHRRTRIRVDAVTRFGEDWVRIRCGSGEMLGED